MASRNYEIERHSSAPPDEGQSNLRLNKEAPEFKPQERVEESKTLNPSAVSFEWNVAGAPTFTPKGSMNASAHTFVPSSMSKLSTEAPEFQLNSQVDEDSLVEKGPSFINKVIDEIDTKNSSLSDIEIPCAYVYSIEYIRKVFAELDQEESAAPPENLIRIRDRAKTNPQSIKHHDKKNKEGWKQRERKDSRIETEKWRNEILQEKQKLIDKARLYRERLRKPIQEREKIKRTIKITLNKLSPNNLERLREQLLNVAVESLDNLDLLAESIFDKAWAESKYTQMYAQLCGYFSKEFEQIKFSESVGIKNEFKNALLLYVEQSFKSKEILNLEGLSEEEKQEKLLMRKKKIEGNVRFIGELFNVGLIPIKIMLHCVDVLLLSENTTYENVDFSIYEINEENLFGACILLETGAVKLDNPKIIERTNRVYHFLNKLSASTHLPNKVKFKIMNLIEERQNGWRKSKLEELKTIEQIHADYHREKEEKKFNYH